MIKVARVYEIRLPAEVRGLLQHLSFIISMGLEGVPLACIGAKGYLQRLLLWMLLPLIVVAVLVIAVVAQLQAASRFSKTLHPIRFPTRERREKKRFFERAMKRVTPLVMRIFFLAYPIVTNVAFEAFSCFEFEGSSSWLIADVSIQCGSDEHLQAQALARVAIAIYPIGLIVLNASLLFHARHAISFGPRTELSKALAFLHSEYKPQFLCAATASR